jgi:asparagine synthase (glutamine-hydrolysing)
MSSSTLDYLVAGPARFGGHDERYFRLIDRSTDLEEEVNWAVLGKNRVFERFLAIFNNQSNVHKEAYFDKMTHFDFKRLCRLCCK